MNADRPSPASDREIVSARVFDASRAEVFDAWMTPEKLARWWGPEGFTNTLREFDPRPGGAWRSTMRAPDGTEYPQHSVFAEIVPREWIVFDHTPPHKYRGVVTFDDVDGKTRMTFRMIHETADECAQVRTVVEEGNEQNFDRLDAVLKEDKEGP